MYGIHDIPSTYDDLCACAQVNNDEDAAATNIYIYM